MFGSGMSTIFMLHRVHPMEEGKLPPNEALKIAPEVLEDFITTSRKKGYTFLSLDELRESLGKNTLKKTFVITLDDGYQDNFSYGYPVLKRNRVPFAIYVTTAFPDHQAILWWFEIEDLILGNEKIILTDGSTYICRSKEEKLAVFFELRKKIISLPGEDFSDQLDRLFKNYIIDWKSKVQSLALTWNQIQEMSNDSIATIGAHTINHLRSSSLTRDNFIAEVLGSKKIIESRTGKPVHHFCYPFGSREEVGEREFKIIKSLDFKTATTTRAGNIFPYHLNHTEALPRITLSNSYNWNEHYFCYLKELVTGRRMVE